MHDFDLKKIDLNLLVTLDALLTERSVTAAARRLGVGQPAASHALARLREAFGDPLFVRSGRTMEPTPRAEALRQPLARLLVDVQHLLTQQPTFAPEHSTRTFRLACPDLLGPFSADLLAALHAQAPRVGLAVIDSRQGPTEAARTGRYDLALGGPGPGGSGIMQRTLGRVRWCVLARRDHPVAAGPLTLERWTAWPHVLVRTGSSSRSYIEAALSAVGVERRIGIEVPSFLSGPLVVARTDLLLTAPQALVDVLLEPLGLVALDPPIEVPDVPIVACWPERIHADPAHRWFRGVVAGVVADVLGR